MTQLHPTFLFIRENAIPVLDACLPLIEITQELIGQVRESGILSVPVLPEVVVPLSDAFLRAPCVQTVEEPIHVTDEVNGLRHWIPVQFFQSIGHCAAEDLGCQINFHL